jgi:polysaccharide biosynthesis/export protein
MFQKHTPLIFLIFILLLSSCASKKNILYLQDAISLNNNNTEKTHETKFNIDDLLLIHVSSKDSEAAFPFNLEVLMTPQASGAGQGQRQQQLYLIDNNGFIEFPVLGRLKLLGLTRSEVISLFKERLSEYIVDPIIVIRIMNFKVSVLGEVRNPGVVSTGSERMTILDAISLAGDLSIFGKRKNVLIIRENNGKKISKRLDLTKSDIVYSDFFYLKQNDVVYVEPNRTKVNSSAVGSYITVGMSVMSFFLTMYVFLRRQ